MKVEKEALRERMRALMHGLPADVKHHAGEAVAEHLAAFCLTLAPKHVGLFSSLRDEINLAPVALKLQQLGLQVLVANLTDDSLNTWLEKELAAVLVPGLAFTPSGDRLGRGKGCYDRFLVQYRQKFPNALAIGVAMDEQILQKLPLEDHDQKVDMLCTPSAGLVRVLGPNNASK